MSNIRDFCPLWGEWEVEKKIGEGSFGAVWKIRRNAFGDKVYYAAVKHISIPKDDSEIDRLIGEGIFSDDASAVHYYSHMLQSITDEIDAMHRLQGYTNIVTYEDHKIIPKEGGIGYDLFLRMELLKPLTERIRQGMSLKDVISLGKDIATAIDVLSDHQMIHRDIKPQNIFVNDREIYKLGDYGTARALGTGATAMSRKGTYSYMSPEIYNNQKADIRADIYSLGLVLYRLLNRNRLPFLPTDKQITSEDSDKAVLQRISGEKIAPPENADEELAAIVLKACAFDPDERYRNAGEMIRDLDRYSGNLNEQIQNDDSDMTVSDPHIFTFGSSTTGQSKGRKTNNKLESGFEQQSPEKSQDHGDATVAELPPKPEIPKTAPEKSESPAMKTEPPISKTAQQTPPSVMPPETPQRKPAEPLQKGLKKKKWLIPVIILLVIGATVGVLWWKGVLLPRPPEQSPSPTIETITELPTDTSTLEPTDNSTEPAETETASAITTVPPTEASEPETTQENKSDNSSAISETETVQEIITENPTETPIPVFTITWQDDAGKTIETTTAEYGTKPIPQNANPTKEADQQYTYTFSKWEPELKDVTGDATYQAAFKKEPRSYTITWQDDAGKTIDTTTVAYGAKPAHADPEKESDQQYVYTFSGWQPNLENVTGDVTYKATFKEEPRTYTITWQDDTGKTIDTTTEAYGTEPTHSNPKKESDQQYTYLFASWEPTIEKVTGEATYKAMFLPVPLNWTCSDPDCRNVNRDIDNFCTKCGKPRETATPAETHQNQSDTSNTWVCDNCKAENSFDDIFCTNCAQTKLCLECGHSVPRDDKFCANCSTEVGKWKCSQCGEILDINDMFCTNCGTKRHKPGAQ